MLLSRRLFASIFAIVWFAGIAAIVAGGFQVDGYLLHVRHIPLPHPYPRGGVLSMCVVVTVESALLYAITVFRVRDHERRRLGLATFLALLLWIFFGAINMHAPPYMGWHVTWLMMFMVVLFSLGLGDASASVLRKITG